MCCSDCVTADDQWIGFSYLAIPQEGLVPRLHPRDRTTDAVEPCLHSSIRPGCTQGHSECAGRAVGGKSVCFVPLERRFVPASFLVTNTTVFHLPEARFSESTRSNACRASETGFASQVVIRRWFMACCYVRNVCVELLPGERLQNDLNW